MDRGSLSEPENRLGVLNEPPCAEPHAGWCGGWRLDTSGYPIINTIQFWHHIYDIDLAANVTRKHLDHVILALRHSKGRPTL